MSDENGTRNFFQGLLLGGLAGAVSGLLFAPKSGKQLRQDLRAAAKELAQEAREVVTEAGEEVKELAEHGKEKVKEGVQKVKGGMS